MACCVAIQEVAMDPIFGVLQDSRSCSTVEKHPPMQDRIRAPFAEVVQRILFLLLCYSLGVFCFFFSLESTGCAPPIVAEKEGRRFHLMCTSE